MQINGAHLATAFAPKSIELEQPTRAPIIIDATSFDIDEQSKPVLESQETQQARIVNDEQQARFIRLFSTAAEPSVNDSKSQSLPKGVQQYLQVAQLNSDDGQQLLDERV